MNLPSMEKISKLEGIGGVKIDYENCHYRRSPTI